MLGEVEFVVGLTGVNEREGEGAQGLVVGGFAGFGVLFGFKASGQVRLGRALWFSLDPVQVSEDALVAALPAEGLCGGEHGREVASQPGRLGQSAAGGLGQAAPAVGHLLVSAA